MYCPKFFCLTVPKNSYGNPSVLFQKISGSENFMDTRGGGVSRFSVEIFFCLTMPKRFIGEPFCAVFQKYSGGEKIDGLERRGIKTFRRKNFVSQCRKNSYGNLSVLCFRKLAVAKKLMDERGGGGIKIFRRKFLVSQ